MFKYIYLAIFFVLSPTMAANHLKIGLSSEMNTLDPHMYVLGANLAFARHVFDPLILQDEKQNIIPGLATSWKNPTPTTWVLSLRQNVIFHNGQPFTAEDALASLKRAQTLQKGLSAFACYFKHIKTAVALDPFTLQITTHQPYALTLSDLCLLSILPKDIATKYADHPLTPQDIIGTGPYRFSHWKRGEHYELIKNQAYWGGVEPWDKVTFYILARDRTRSAALLSNHVDLIDSAPLTDLKTLEKRTTLHTDMSTRIVYLSLDVSRESSPFVKGAPQNPLRDPNFRHHLSTLIDRNHLCHVILNDAAVPAYQFAPPGMPAYFDAKQTELIKDHHLPKGLHLTIHGPQGRYPSDHKVLESIAMMWTQKGVPTKSESLVSTLFFPQVAKRMFSITLNSWPGNREVSPLFKAALHTHEVACGYGVLNHTGYSNLQLDKLLKESLRTINESERYKKLEQINRLAVEDMPLIPLYFLKNVWASRKGLLYKPRLDDLTLAMSVREAG